jgi:hypothetical protein
MLERYSMTCQDSLTSVSSPHSPSYSRVSEDFQATRQFVHLNEPNWHSIYTVRLQTGLRGLTSFLIVWVKVFAFEGNLASILRNTQLLSGQVHRVPSLLLCGCFDCFLPSGPPSLSPPPSDRCHLWSLILICLFLNHFQLHPWRNLEILN